MRPSLLVLLLVVALGAAGGGLWYFAYGMGDAPPASARVPGLAAEATVRWGPDAVAVTAASEADALRALGYAHGLRHGWTAALWRQTALGGLSRWFGDGTLPLDRHARTLGFAATARAAYDALAPATRARYDAYADGLDAALASRFARRQDAFVLLGVAPAAWAPWHTLAVERLLAWMGTPPLATHPPLDTLAPAAWPAQARAFARRDALLRRWLHLHAFDRSVAAAARDTATGGTVLAQRHVYGDAALPLTMPTVVRVAGAAARHVLTVPGTRLAPGGRTAQAAWALFLTSPAHLDTLRTAPRTADRTADRADVAALPLPSYDRLRTATGREVVVPIYRTPDGLPLGALPSAIPGTPQDTTMPNTAALDTTTLDTATLGTVRVARALRLRWPGFRPAVTDAAAWHALTQGAPGDAAADTATANTANTATADTSAARFRLWRGDGLHVALGPRAAATPPRVLGRPVVADTLPGGLVVGGSAWARAQGAPLRAEPLDAAAWATRDASAWADTLRAAWTPALAPLGDRDTTLAQALAYLRNWNGAYDRASIGASLFDAWMARLHVRRGRRPTLPDTAYFGAYRRRQAFAAAVMRLRRRFGPDLRRWRWERVAPDRRPYPVWSADSLTARDLGALAQTTFAPRVQPGQGHPSAPAGGPSLALPSAPAAVTAWTDDAGGLTLLRLTPPARAFLSRYTMPDRRRTPTPLAVPADAPATRLRPEDTSARPGG